MLFESFCFWEFKSLLTDGGVYFSRRHPRRGSRARRARQRVDRVFEVGEGALAGCGGGGKAAAPILLRCGYFDPADRFLQFMDQFAEESLVDTERLFQFRLGDATGSGAELECGEDDSGVMAEERRGRNRLPGSPQVQEELGSGFPPGSHRGKCIPAGVDRPVTEV